MSASSPDGPVRPDVAPAATGGTPVDAPAVSSLEKREVRKARVRLIGCVAIAVLAVLTLAFLGPTDSDDVASERLAIWLEDATNQDRTQGAPQQSVVNGWTANQLLDLLSQQLETGTSTDDRPAVLLTLGVLLLALAMATTPRADPSATAGRHAPGTQKGGEPPWLRSP